MLAHALIAGLVGVIRELTILYVLNTTFCKDGRISVL